MLAECSPDSPCGAVRVLTSEMVRQGEDIIELRRDVKSLQNRLPHWATLLISLLMFVIGILASKVGSI